MAKSRLTSRSVLLIGFWMFLAPCLLALSFMWRQIDTSRRISAKTSFQFPAQQSMQSSSRFISVSSQFPAWKMYEQKDSVEKDITADGIGGRRMVGFYHGTNETLGSRPNATETRELVFTRAVESYSRDGKHTKKRRRLLQR